MALLCRYILLLSSGSKISTPHNFQKRISAKYQFEIKPNCSDSSIEQKKAYVTDFRKTLLKILIIDEIRKTH